MSGERERFSLTLMSQSVSCTALLDTKEKIEFVRQMTEATNNLYYFDLQRQLWQAYDDIGMQEGV